MSVLSQRRARSFRIARHQLSAEWRSALRFGVGAAVAYRVVSLAVATAAAYGPSAWSAVAAGPGAIVSPWVRWDAVWQVLIAQFGFVATAHAAAGAHAFSSAAFQPLLPGLMHALATATGASLPAAGLVIAPLATTAAAVCLHRLVALDHGDAAARSAVVLLLVFPSAVFLGAPYAEPLVLAELLAAFLAVRGGRPLLGGVLVGVAGMTKAYALVAAVPLAVEAWSGAAPAARQRLIALLRAGAGPLLGASGLFVFYALVFHDPLRFVAAERDWTGRALAAPWVSVWNDLHPWPALTLNDAAHIADLLCVPMLAAAVVFAWRRLRPSYALLLALQLLVFTSTSALVSTSRWTLDAFPLFVAGGVLAAGHRKLRLTLVAISLPASLLLLWIFARGGWAG